ncbi:unnamed protein product [Cochlearia groenlandica]
MSFVDAIMDKELSKDKLGGDEPLAKTHDATQEGRITRSKAEKLAKGVHTMLTEEGLEEEQLITSTKCSLMQPKKIKLEKSTPISPHFHLHISPVLSLSHHRLHHHLLSTSHQISSLGRCYLPHHSNSTIIIPPFHSVTSHIRSHHRHHPSSPFREELSFAIELRSWPRSYHLVSEPTLNQG